MPSAVTLSISYPSSTVTERVTAISFTLSSPIFACESGACGQIARCLRNFHVEINALRGRTVARQTDIGVSRGEIRAFGGRIRHHFAARREGRALVGDLRDQRNAVTVCEQRLEVRAVIGETRFGRRAVSHQIHALRDRLRRAAVAQIEHNHAARARVRPRSLHARLRQSQRGEQRIQEPSGASVRHDVGEIQFDRERLGHVQPPAVDGIMNAVV